MKPSEQSNFFKKCKYPVRRPLPKLGISSTKQLPRNLQRFSSDGKNSNKHAEIKKENIKSKEIFIAALRNDVDHALLHCQRGLHEAAESAEHPEMCKDTQKKILKLLPDELLKKYGFIYDQLLEETIMEYRRRIQELSIHFVLKPLPGEEQVIVKEQPFKYHGRTKNYHMFLKRRYYIETHMFMTHPVIRGILSWSTNYLPTLWVDYTKYRNLGIVDINEVDKAMALEINNIDQKLHCQWYPKIVSLLVKEEALANISPQLLPNFIRCASNVIRVQITQLIYKILNSLLDISRDTQKLPFLRLELFCDGEEVEMIPDMSEIIKLFTALFDDIMCMGQDLPCLETWVGMKSETKSLPVSIPIVHILPVRQKLVENVYQQYVTIVKHKEIIDETYYELYSGNLEKNITKFLETEHSFNDYCIRINYLRSYYIKTYSLFENEYFDAAKLGQTSLINKLKCLVSNCIDQITTVMLQKQHKNNERVCAEFEEVAKKALKVPTNTEELMKQKEYMSWAVETFIMEMDEKLETVVEDYEKLVELASFTEEQIQTTAQVLLWKHEIKPIFARYTSVYDEYKLEFEEQLSRATENLNKEIEDLLPKLAVLDYMDDADNAADYLNRMKTFLKKLDEFDNTVSWINKEELLFKFPLSTYPELDELKQYICPFANLLYLIFKWNRSLHVWLDGNFYDLISKDIEDTSAYYHSEIINIQNFYRMKIKQQVAENNPRRFKGNVEDPDIANLPAPLKLCMKTIESINEFRKHIPVIKILCNPALTQQHWDELSEITGFDLTPDAGTTLRKMVKLKIEPYLDKFEIVSISANKEKELKEFLEKMLLEWVSMSFTIVRKTDSNLPVLSSVDYIEALLDDHLVKIVAMRGSAFVRPIQERVQHFYNKLLELKSTLKEWENVQNDWLYLHPIFLSKAVTDKIPSEGHMFQEVDHLYVTMMESIETKRNVMECVDSIQAPEKLIICKNKLDAIKKGVAMFLETRRLLFPRLYFLSDNAVLDLFSAVKDLKSIHLHLKSCFEGIAKLHFDDHLNIVSMQSEEGETVAFVNPIPLLNSADEIVKLLSEIENQMTTSIKFTIKESYRTYPLIEQFKWLQLWPGQAIHCTFLMYCTAEVQGILNGTNKTNLLDYGKWCQHYVIQVLKFMHVNLSTFLRISLENLVLLVTHTKEVIEQLENANISSSQDFCWLSQLRYYWDNDIILHILNTKIKYAYEYLGSITRLVVTPLTTRCYHTLMGAYHLHLQGVAVGNSGTGKTETIKDIAKAIATPCIVFNCNKYLQYKTMEKLLKGIALSGAWACFDEFSQIKPEVLSVVAQQLLCIVKSLQAGTELVTFDSATLRINPACYICATMNTTYSLTSGLPDNLKSLFRPVAMVVPDYALISEMLLYSYGYINARTLSIKVVKAFHNLAKQLPSQYHYDYGLRALKFVLREAGNLKMKFPDQKEDILIVQAIHKMTISKYTTEDATVSKAIIMDFFPELSITVSSSDMISNICRECCSKRNLQPVELFITKVIQTYHMMVAHHSIMIVGEPFSAKTTCLQVLADSLSKIPDGITDANIVKYTVINPKSVGIEQIFGYADPIKNEWIEGILGCKFREYSMETSSDRNWIIFDGPLDPKLFENMCTLLDDSKKLCLSSGAIMQLRQKMSIIFETADVSQASPAMMCRCSVTYMETSALDWRAIIKSWIQQANPKWQNQKLVMDMLEWLLPPCLNFIEKYKEQSFNAGMLNLVRSVTLFIEMQLNDATNINDDLQFLSCWIQAACFSAGVWVFGGTLDTVSREHFDEFYRSLWKGNLEHFPLPASIDKLEISVPTEGTLFDYIYQFKGKGCWKYWNESSRSVPVVERRSITRVLIPTVETMRCNFLMTLHASHNCPLLIVGPSGTGKTFIMHDILKNTFSEENYVSTSIALNAHTQVNFIQDAIIGKLIKIKKANYSAPKGKRCLVFLDDINIAAKDAYGAKPTLELIRQYFDHRHWFDKRTKSEIYLQDILLFGAMTSVVKSSKESCKQFLRHFSIYYVDHFSVESMTKIYSSLLLLGLKRTGFSTDVTSNIIPIISATINVYQSIKHELKPTPEKLHYAFNLRDISRVVLGCSQLRKESADSKKIFIKLWVHETLRVFSDRLTENKDKIWLSNKICSCIQDHFKETPEQALELEMDIPEQVTEDMFERLMFGKFMDKDSLSQFRKYEQVPNMQTISDYANLAVEEYNATHTSKVDIVLFEFALQHLSRICRVLSMPEGNILLIGIAGSGRQSLVKLASVMTRSILFQPFTTKQYGMNEWRNDLKRVLRTAGVEYKSATVLLSEHQLKKQCILQDVNSLLCSADVPNLHNIYEQQEIVEHVRLAAQEGKRNLDISVTAVLNFFTESCKQNLHLALCCNPLGQPFQNQLRSFPSLISCCTIDWFQNWPEAAMEKVASKHLADVEYSEDIKNAAIESFKFFHATTRSIYHKFQMEQGTKLYLTSAAYLELIQSFKKLTNVKQQEIMTAKLRYLGGLDKLAFAEQQVHLMQRELSELKPQLVAAAEQTVTMMNTIEKETVKVQIASQQVRKDENVANIQAAAAQELKNECEADLAQAIPVLEDAIAALNTLKPTDITLVKSMKNPPDAVKLVMAAVCVMKDIKPDRINDAATGRKIIDYWGPSKRVLGDMYFLQSLKDFDKDNIPSHIMKAIRKDYLPHKDFKPHIVAKASSAAEGLCKWIIAMDMYDAVAKEVAPKKEKLRIAEKEYNETMEVLKMKRLELETLERQLKFLVDKLHLAQEKKSTLEQDVAKCTNKLRRAEKIISGLGGEKTRWLEAANNLQRSYDSLPGDILISSGTIAYLSPLTAMYRYECKRLWLRHIDEKDIPCSEKYDFIKMLETATKIQSWNIAGLPKDEFSIENAIIVENCIRFPLLIDPQGHANKWIKCYEKENDLIITKLTERDYMQKIELCISCGKPILLEGLEQELEMPLNLVLERSIYEKDSSLYFALGENAIEYNTSFRFYMTTKLSHPCYLPEVFNTVGIINFSLTIEGLEDQLLEIVIAKERPDLEEKRQNDIAQSTANEKALKDVEESILVTLSEASGNILEDEEAIEILDTSKILSADIKMKQVQAQESTQETETFCFSYHPIAKHSAILYECISKLVQIDTFYQYSLEWFINLYVTSIERSNKSKNLERRLKYLYDTFTYSLFKNISQSLFQKDRQLFAFIMCISIIMNQQVVEKEDVEFLLTGKVENKNKNPVENPAAIWLSDSTWNEVCRMSELKAFKGFITSFKENLDLWKVYYDNSKPKRKDIPDPWNSILTDIQELIIIKIFHPEKISDAINELIRNNMGEKYIQPSILNLESPYSDSNCLIPLMLIPSPGSHPMNMLNSFAKKMGYSAKLVSISLGEGQELIAESVIKKAQQAGYWVCLQNCHLAVLWMLQLEKQWESMDLKNTNFNFRLWLTSYSTDKFPLLILQNAIKIVTECPSGLQQNILSSYHSDPLADVTFIDGCPGKQKEFSRLLYGISFFHAVVQERKTFGPIGWNILYEFNLSDLQISLVQLQTLVNEHPLIPYSAITYLVGECNYGGHITDEWDRRTLLCILGNYINSSVVNDPDYSSCSYDEGSFRLPRKVEYDAYIEHIKRLPLTTSSEILGLHVNAEIAREQNYTNSIFEKCSLIYGNKKRRKTLGAFDQFLLDVITDILVQLPPELDAQLISMKYPIRHEEPMNLVFIQEVRQLSLLHRVMKSSLQSLQDAIKGLSILSPEMEEIADSLCDGKVPEIWHAFSYPSSKPLGSYITDFLERSHFFQEWYENGNPNIYRISVFSSIQAFLMAALQNHARQYRISIDLLIYDFQVMYFDYTDDYKVQEGVLINGLFLEAAHWDRSRCKLAESLPKILWEKFPCLWLKPTMKCDLTAGSRYICPWYRSIQRYGINSNTGHSVNYVMAVLLDTDETSSHWVERGVALFCQLHS